MSGNDSEFTVDVSLPGWVKALRPLADVVGTLRAFASDPFKFVATIISAYILQAVFDVLGVVAGSILYAFDLIVAALGFVQGYLVSGFGVVGIDILAALTELQVAVAGIVDGAGPAGPILAVGLAAAGTYLAYRVGSYVLALINPA